MEEIMHKINTMTNELDRLWAQPNLDTNPVATRKIYRLAHDLRVLHVTANRIQPATIGASECNMNTVRLVWAQTHLLEHRRCVIL